MWFFGGTGTLISGLICLYEGLKLVSENNSKYNSRYIRHYIIIVSLSLILFVVFVILYYLFGFIPNSPLNIDNGDLTSLH